MKLAASLLVKDELGRYLEPVIDHLRDFCDLIVVQDDGSSDGTYGWLLNAAERAGNQLVIRQTPTDGFFDGHEGRRRQALLEFTLEQKPDYVLAIDADEFVADGQRVRDFCETGQPIGTLVMQEVWEMDMGELRIRQDGGWREHPVPILWQVPRKLAGRWHIQDRALACGREPLAIRDNLRSVVPTGTEILHFGWADPANRHVRYQRYRIADNGQFHNRRHLDSILWAGRRVQLTSRPWPERLRLEAAIRYGA